MGQIVGTFGPTANKQTHRHVTVENLTEQRVIGKAATADGS